MNIEVGDYVRIDNGFRLIALGIGRVVHINQDTVYIKMSVELPFAFKIDNIKKHSKNIIDLIEVGDIVFIQDVLLNDDDFIYINDEEMLKAVKEDIEDGLKISKVLTHEQFKASCYTVESEEK